VGRRERRVEESNRQGAKFFFICVNLRNPWIIIYPQIAQMCADL